MEYCKDMITPMNQKEKLSKNDGVEKVEETYFRGLVGYLMYLTATRPDSLYAVSILSRFMHCASEAEFVAATVAVNQALWSRIFFVDLHMNQKKGTEVFVDNQSAIGISHNPVFHGKTKHFNIKLFFLRELQNNGDLILLYCKTEEQLADIFTKPLSSNKFQLLEQKLGFCSS
ncbi:hypothetical protein MTR67_018621 [Solanum verrucosum]|uniref:Copia protein n=1 Tax=Solanum verrucosum TaxID=315347 RepID=A0AAF0TMJ5_SOLVR|nr:hypothetical protein MTR67_018621 [Solanum verrucosum]